MLKSVYTYGGFWIGRYEAGIEGSITEDMSKGGEQIYHGKFKNNTIRLQPSPKAISQKDAIPYNWVYL